jgi:hypothetical protein
MSRLDGESSIDSDLALVSLRLGRIEAACRNSPDPRVRRAAWTATYLRARTLGLTRRLARIGRARQEPERLPPAGSGRVRPLVTLGPGGEFNTNLVPRGSRLDVLA